MMKNNNKIIKNVRIINPATQTDQMGSIVIKNGIISELKYGEDISLSEYDFANEEIIDAKGLIASPGLIDIHVHFRDPGQTHKEDMETGAKAAARGGFTSVIMMANTVPSVDCPEVLESVLKKASALPVHVYATSSVSKGLKGKELSDFANMVKSGAAGFTDDGIPIMDENLLREALKNAKSLDMPVSLHEEDPSLIKNSGVNAGIVAEKMGLGGAMREAEYTLIERDIRIGIETGAKLNIQHISSKEGVELVRRARNNHENIHAEATPHHFSLTEDAVLTHGTLAKMNPPLRTEEDRMAIIEGLKDGTIEYIATDHAPHAKEEKDQEFTKAPSGIIGLETSLALGITELVEKGYLTYLELLEKMTINPAILYSIEAGDISEGKSADIVLFDPKEKWKVADFASKSSNSPFVGRTLTGKVKYTIVNGTVVYEDK